MFVSYLPNLAARIKKCARDSVVSLVPNIAALDYPDSSGTPPFFALQLSPFSPLPNEYPFSTEDFTGQVRLFTLHLILGKLTQGYQGENASLQYQYDELVIYHFKSNRLLLSADYATPAPYLDAYGVQMTNGTGMRFIDYGGVDNTMFASSYTITAPIHLTNLD